MNAQPFIIKINGNDEMEIKPVNIKAEDKFFVPFLQIEKFFMADYCLN